MFRNEACTINGKHTYRDYGLYVANSMPVSPPVVRRQTVEVPGRNGDVDLTEALTGYPLYDNRQITLVLNGKKPHKDWPKFISSFLNEVHGKKVRVIFDNDPNYYYEGRAEVEAEITRGEEVCSFQVIVDVAPYKLRTDETDGWIWDTFSFEDGEIIDYSEIAISGETEVKVQVEAMPVIPVITASAAMTVEYRGKTYSLTAGENKVYGITLMQGENELTFTGTGTVGIRYRNGRL